MNMRLDQDLQVGDIVDVRGNQVKILAKKLIGENWWEYEVEFV